MNKLSSLQGLQGCQQLQQLSAKVGWGVVPCVKWACTFAGSAVSAELQLAFDM
jgi:hypothetical protein